MKNPAIKIVWSMIKGEAKLVISDSFHNLHKVDKMDCLADALHDLKMLYNDTLKNESY